MAPRLFQPLATLAVALALIAPDWASSAEVVKYYHLDAIGNVRLVTDRNGAQLERFDYHPFGEDIVPPATPTHLRFAGKERDAETGLDYFGARYYFSRTARFTSVDPIYTWQESLVDPQMWNRYSYAHNNPLRYVDPDGRTAIPAQIEQFGRQVQAIPHPGAKIAGLALVGLGVGAAVVTDPERVGAAMRFVLTHGGAPAGHQEMEALRITRTGELTDRYLSENQGEAEGRFVVDPHGNAIPLKPGETVTSSPDGRWIQVRDSDGNPTGVRLDGPHKPSTHSDPRAQESHAHIPGVTNPDGTPWLPVNKPE